MEGNEKQSRFLFGFSNDSGRMDNIKLIVVTHLLSDRLVFLPALSQIAPIHRVLAIPYSYDAAVGAALQRDFEIETPTLSDLQSEAFLEAIIDGCDTDVIIVDIGGYFSFLQSKLPIDHKRNVIGIVEDTEAGHRRYEVCPTPRLPVFSVARSPLKSSEDYLVGPSAAYSLEGVFRQAGHVLNSANCTVLGFGKVGKGTAFALRARNQYVSVFDIDKTRLIEALGMGFRIPTRDAALGNADIIVAATGKRSIDVGDLTKLKDGVFLVSVSSRDIEFPVSELEARSAKTNCSGAVTTYDLHGKAINLVYGGRPLNFRDGAVMDSFLCLTQAEIIRCIQRLLRNAASPTGMNELSPSEREEIISRWVDEFIDQQSGSLTR